MDSRPLNTFTVAEQILDLFPLQDLPSESAEASSMNDHTVDRLKEVQRNLILQKPVPPEDDGEPEDVKRPGDHYRHYRRTEELPENVKAFYGKAGKLGHSIIVLA
jgi:RNA polymerase I-specific transcription initiation factor RRN7